MRTKQVVRYLTIVSAVMATTCAGSVSLADSEASFQAGSQASTQTSSENGHVGESQANRQSTNEGGTGSTSNAINQSSTEAQDEAGRVPVLQPSATGLPRTTNSKQPAAAGSGRTGVTTTGVRPTSASTRSSSASIPHEKTTTYRWNHGHTRSRVSSRTSTNKAYMVNTIHQAASTK